MRPVRIRNRDPEVAAVQGALSGAFRRAQPLTDVEVDAMCSRQGVRRLKRVSAPGVRCRPTWVRWLHIARGRLLAIGECLAHGERAAALVLIADMQRELSSWQRLGDGCGLLTRVACLRRPRTDPSPEYDGEHANDDIYELRGLLLGIAECVEGEQRELARDLVADGQRMVRHWLHLRIVRTPSGGYADAMPHDGTALSDARDLGKVLDYGNGVVHLRRGVTGSNMVELAPVVDAMVAADQIGPWELYEDGRGT